jgi:ribonuclease PH
MNTKTSGLSLTSPRPLHILRRLCGSEISYGDIIFMRSYDRAADELRPWIITSGVLELAEGSAMIECGRTKVLCAASIEERVPPFLLDKGQGWVTAEYSMLPRSTHTRSPRERGKVGGRTLEIQRLIGRALRCVTDMKAFGQRTITIDCDVIQADGGTRVAAITGAYVALYDAFRYLGAGGVIDHVPLVDSVSAVSVGIVNGDMLLDLDYSEDSNADVDMNVVMTGKGELIELQATAERIPFSLQTMNDLVNLAGSGLNTIRKIQVQSLET